jgi:hypothetical protein
VVAPKINERRWFVLIIFLYLFLAVGYSLLMPLWEAPDEPAHYHLAWFFARFGRFPPLQQNYEADQPRSFYYLGSWIIRGLDKVDPRLSDYYIPQEYSMNMNIAVRRFDWNLDNYRFLLGVYILRWINIVFGAIALWFIWMAFRLIEPEKPELRAAALALAALTPQFLHIMSSVSNDPLGTLAGALLFYLAIRVTTSNSNLLPLISVPLAVILPLTTKLTAFPVGVALLLTICWQQFARIKQKKQLIYLGLSLLSIPVILYFLFPGVVKPAIYELQWRIFTFAPDAFTYKYLDFILRQIIWTYWGKVGWLAVGLPPVVVILLTLSGLIGMGLNARELVKTRSMNTQLNLWIITWLTGLFSLAAVIKNGLTTMASQGRFLFPAIGALSLLMLAGWHSVLPQKQRVLLPSIILVLMLICNLGLWLFGIIPVYYQPFLG